MSDSEAKGRKRAPGRKASAADPAERKQRRKEQNRRAQVAFRQRQEDHLRGLENAAAANKQVGVENSRRLREHATYLRGVVATLLDDNRVLLEALRRHPGVRVDDLNRIINGEHLLAAGLAPEPELLDYPPPVEPVHASKSVARSSPYPESPPASDGTSPPMGNGSVVKTENIFGNGYGGYPSAQPPAMQQLPFAAAPQTSYMQPLADAASMASLHSGQSVQGYSVPAQPFAGSPGPYFTQQLQPQGQNVMFGGAVGGLQDSGSLMNFGLKGMNGLSNLGVQQDVLGAPALDAAYVDDPIFLNFPENDPLFGSLMNVPVPDDEAPQGVAPSIERPPAAVFKEFADRLLASYGIFLDAGTDADGNPTLDLNELRINQSELPMMPVVNVPSPVQSNPSPPQTGAPEVCVVDPLAQVVDDDKLSRCIQALPNLTMREKIKALRRSGFVNVDKLCEDVRGLARCHGNPKDIRDWSLPSGFFDRWPVLRGIPIRVR